MELADRSGAVVYGDDLLGIVSHEPALGDVSDGGDGQIVPRHRVCGVGVVVGGWVFVLVALAVLGGVERDRGGSVVRLQR